MIFCLERRSDGGLSPSGCIPRLEKGLETNISIGCTDTKAAEKARKEQKKRAKKCKDPSLRYLEPDYKDEAGEDLRDPDRPFLPINKETGVVEAKPLVSGATTESVKHPSKKSAYFGASEDDDSEGFATFTNVIGDDPAYRLSSLTSGTEKEVASVMDMSSGGALLPTPSLEDMWKPMAPAGVHTSFFNGLAPPGGVYPKATSAVYGVEEMKEKMDHIFGRLEALEAERRQNTQTEVLLFVGSGLALLLSLDILSRH
jgi:hypothetical protein